MSGNPLAIEIGNGTLFQLLASNGGAETVWRVPTLYEGKALSAGLLIGSVTTPFSGTREISGTGGTVSLKATYDASTLAKLGTNPYRQPVGRDDWPLKTEIMPRLKFGFIALRLPVSVPVRLSIDLYATDAQVQLLVNAKDGGLIPPGSSTRTVEGFDIGFYVALTSSGGNVSLVWEYETPTAHWRLAGTDDAIGLGRLGASPAALIISRSEDDDQVIGVLRAKVPGLSAPWIAAQDPLPGGWSPQPDDVYLGAGDIDGDGNAETLAVSKEPVLGGRVGVLHYDSATDGLITTTVAKDTITGGWQIDPLDTWVPVGAIDTRGRARLLVQSQYDGRDHAAALGLIEYDLTRGSLRTISIATGTIPGGWTISAACSYGGSDIDGYIGAGDIDNDGLAEIVAWTRDVSAARSLAVLDYDPARLALKTMWMARGVVPGDAAKVPAGWVLDAADNVIAAGAMIESDRTGVLLQRTSPLLPPALAFVRFDLLSRGQVYWLGTTTIGPWALAATDKLLPLGGVNGDGLTEVLIRDQPLSGPCSLALLRDDTHGGITATGKATGSIGGWTLSRDDEFTVLGDIDGDGRAEILLRDASGDGPNHAALLRWDTAANAFAVSWEVTATIPGLLP